ncbi:hypothetical protein D3C84_731310 [compost metagenome]
MRRARSFTRSVCCWCTTTWTLSGCCIHTDLRSSSTDFTLTILRFVLGSFVLATFSDNRLLTRLEIVLTARFLHTAVDLCQSFCNRPDATVDAFTTCWLTEHRGVSLDCRTTHDVF